MAKFYTKLDELANLDSPTLILSTREASRGIDFRTKDNSHVAVCFKTTEASEIDQAIGRGCRAIECEPEGTLFCY